MNKDVPLISVVMCTYNGEKYLRTQLDSILQQTYPRLEIVIVDDVSKDSTWEILTSYQQKHQNIRLYRNEQNLGYIRNFELALQKTTGELIAISDQDDIWELNKLELAYNALGDAILVYHDSALIDQEARPLHKKISDIANMYEGDDFRALLFHNCVSGHSMLFRRALLQHIFPFPANMYYDWWIALIALMQDKIHYIPQCLVQYRQHQSNVTNIQGSKEDELKKKLRKFKQKYRIYKKTKEHLDRIVVLECLLQAPFKTEKDKKYLLDLLKALQEKGNRPFSWKLFPLLMPHVKTIFFPSKASLFDKTKYVFKLAFFRRYDIRLSPEETAEIERILNEK